MSKNADMKRLRKSLTSQGFVVEMVPNGHYRVTAPGGAKAQIAATPSCRRSVLNAVTRLKRIGYDPRA